MLWVRARSTMCLPTNSWTMRVTVSTTRTMTARMAGDTPESARLLLQIGESRPRACARWIVLRQFNRCSCRPGRGAVACVSAGVGGRLSRHAASIPCQHSLLATLFSSIEDRPRGCALPRLCVHLCPFLDNCPGEESGHHEARGQQEFPSGAGKSDQDRHQCHRDQDAQ